MASRKLEFLCPEFRTSELCRDGTCGRDGREGCNLQLHVVAPICVCQAAVAAHAPISGGQQRPRVSQASHSLREIAPQDDGEFIGIRDPAGAHVRNTSRLQLDRYETPPKPPDHCARVVLNGANQGERGLRMPCGMVSVLQTSDEGRAGDGCLRDGLPHRIPGRVQHAPSVGDDLGRALKHRLSQCR